jgi:hypothetical protein
MIAEFETVEAPSAQGMSYAGATVSVKVPVGLPVPDLILHPMRIGAEPFVMVTDRDNALFAVLANRLSAKIAHVLDRAIFPGRATHCSVLESMLGCGYAMASYESAAWLTREIRLVLDMRPEVAAMLTTVKVCENSKKGAA